MYLYRRIIIIMVVVVIIIITIIIIIIIINNNNSIIINLPNIVHKHTWRLNSGFRNRDCRYRIQLTVGRQKHTYGYWDQAGHQTHLERNKSNIKGTCTKNKMFPPRAKQNCYNCLQLKNWFSKYIETVSSYCSIPSSPNALRRILLN